MGNVRSPLNGNFSVSGLTDNRGNTPVVGAPRDNMSLTNPNVSYISQRDVEIRAQELANQMLAQLTANSHTAISGRTYTRFDPSSDVVDNQKTYVTEGLFSNSAATMSVMYTSSLQTTTSKQYYYEVWNGNGSTSEAQFSIAYGNRLGSGSSAAGTLNDSPGRAVYSQYKLLLLEPGDTNFTFADGTSSDSIFAININRARLKDRLDPGNWELSFTDLSGSAIPNASHTGSNVKALNSKFVTLIDDSSLGETNLGNSGRIFNIVSGSVSNGIYNSANPDYYGLAYPDMGMLILNGTKLDASMSFNIVSGSDVAGDNAWKLYTAMSGAMAVSPVSYPFQARNEEVVTSTHYFVRVKNGEYNFSNNPSFTTGSVGEFAQPTFIGDPKTYITTIGMYNDKQELLAVAKLSQPIQKSFSKEALIRVKLDF